MHDNGNNPMSANADVSTAKAIQIQTATGYQDDELRENEDFEIMQQQMQSPKVTASGNSYYNSQDWKNIRGIALQLPMQDSMQESEQSMVAGPMDLDQSRQSLEVDQDRGAPSMSI